MKNTNSNKLYKKIYYINTIKAIAISIIAIIFIALNTKVIYATDTNVLNVTKKASETKYLENDQGYITKTIVDSNANTGEVTIELALANIKKDVTKQRYENTEIFIIIPEFTDEDEEKEKTLEYIETLSNKVFSKSTKTKIGVIGIEGPISDTYKDASGNLVRGENDEVEVKGTENNAEIIVNLTDDISVLKTKLQNMNSQNKEYYENFQASLRLAKNNFSKDVNKILISLYDNVPSTTIGTTAKGPSYGGLFGEYATLEEAIKGHYDKIVKNTKSEILLLKENNIDFILLRPDNTCFDKNIYNGSTGEFLTKIDGAPYANSLYGTLEKPTYGKMYSLNDDNLENIVTKYIYDDIMQIIQSPIENAKIIDYFPKEITQNFDFEYVGTASHGTMPDTINSETNTITWQIGKLQENETAKLRYKLKIKDMSNNSPIFNKEIATNEKVILTYTDTDEKSYEVTLESSPKIKLLNNKEILGTTDTTTSKKILPNAGINIIIIFSILGVTIIAIIGLKKYFKYRDIN